MNVFISHNKADKTTARLLAHALVEQGVNVWFDEWELRPGDSIVGGIEKGLSEANIFVLLWSAKAKESKWVGTEVRAYLRRRVEDDGLRIVPVMLDSTTLPTLIADYKGFKLASAKSLSSMASKITGCPSDIEIARRLQIKLLELTENHYGGDPLPYLVCPRCGSADLGRRRATDDEHDRCYYIIECKTCRWREWTEV